MADIKSKEDRSKNMSAIRSKNTKPEIYLRKLLFNRGYRYRLYNQSLPGNPDLWLKKYNTVVFINGCFWHMHQNCKRSNVPKSNMDYWAPKLLNNVQRDARNKQLLIERGYKCLVIWECSINHVKKDEEARSNMIAAIEDFFRNGLMYEEL